MRQKVGASKIYASIILVLILIFSIGIVIVNAGQGGDSASNSNTDSSGSVDSSTSRVGVSHSTSEVEGLNGVLINLASSTQDQINDISNDASTPSCILNGYGLSGQGFSIGGGCADTQGSILNNNFYKDYTNRVILQGLTSSTTNSPVQIVLCCKQPSTKIKILSVTAYSGDIRNCDIADHHSCTTGHDYTLSSNNVKIFSWDWLKFDVVTNLPASSCRITRIMDSYGDSHANNIGNVNYLLNKYNPNLETNWNYIVGRGGVGTVDGFFINSKAYDTIEFTCTNKLDTNDKTTFLKSRANHLGWFSLFDSS